VRLSDVIGHDRAKGILARALERDRLPPALLLAGPGGVGKKTLALATAQAALCEAAPAREPCGTCATCRRVARATAPESLSALREEAGRHPDEDEWCNFRLHPDLVLVEGWSLTRTGRPRPEPEIRVGQVRDLVAEVPGSPFEARRRVFVIDDAHAMNESSQNALLKSLEEPPPRSHLILVTAQPQGLRQTIRSRCQLLRFGPLPRALVARHLARERGIPEDEAALRAALGAGSLAEALAFESEGYRGMRADLLGLLEGLDHSSALERMEQAEALEQVGDAASLLTTLRSLLRDVAAARAGAPPAGLLNADVADRIGALATGPLGPRAALLAERVGESRRAIRGFGNRLLTFDLLVDALTDG
jgi:DNA polymerase III subunit delta'